MYDLYFFGIVRKCIVEFFIVNCDINGLLLMLNFDKEVLIILNV